MEDMAPLLTALQEINEKRGTSYKKLKDLQEKCTIAASKSDVLCILPTGYGKSLIFECLPRYHSEVNGLATSACVIVSPLNAITEEQINRYGGDAIHINAAFVDALNVHQSLQCTSDCSCPESVKKYLACNFLFAIGHPEQIISKPVFISLRIPSFQSHINHIVVDEAHCISKWGPEFRKDFAKLQELRSVLPTAKVLALTATASKQTQKEVKTTLVMSDCVTIQACIRRENIKLTVKKRPNYVNGSEDSFRMKVKITKSMGDADGIKLLFATEAYGMGTDSPNIRRVIHFGVPKSTETYLQEVGRAGRDGVASDGILYFNNNDIAKNVVGLETEMVEFCKTELCRWDFLCEHFGCKEESRDQHHSCCDNCAMKCSCAECNVAVNNQEVQEDEIVCSKEGLKQMLLQYFEAENSVTAMPHPAMYTGLNETLANDVIKCEDCEEIYCKFSFLKESYLNNIVTIVRSYDQS